IRDRIPVFREMSANLRSRFVNTASAHDAAAGMNPETIFGERLRKQCCTPDGIEFDKNLVEVAHEQFRRSCIHNWLSLNVPFGFLRPHEARSCRVTCVLPLPALTEVKTRCTPAALAASSAAIPCRVSASVPPDGTVIAKREVAPSSAF